MNLLVTSLASGSSGNALLVQAGSAALLVDCGLAQRTIERQLHHAGLEPRDLAAILLTHEHGDHTLSAVPFARRHGVPLMVNQPTANALGLLSAGVAFQVLPTGSEIDAGGPVRAQLPRGARRRRAGGLYDQGGRAGVLVLRSTWAPGMMPCCSSLTSADLVVLEANHDRERLRAAPYALADQAADLWAARAPR